MRSVSLALLSLTLAAAQAEIARLTTTFDSQTVQRYVARLGEKFEPELHTSVVERLQDPVALPGGYMFVPVSLILRADSEAEFAAMLAQIIARGRISIGSDSGSIPIIFVGGGNSVIPVALIDRMRARVLRADTVNRTL
jgi:hypothetical protein